MESGEQVVEQFVGNEAIFDIISELRKWRKPFKVRPFYGDDDVAELESHLLDCYSNLLARGVAEQNAFREAVAQVGPESQLRCDYRSEWLKSGSVRRYFSLFKAELGVYDSKFGVITYGVGRSFSLVMGVVSAYSFGYTLVRASWPLEIWRSGRPLHQQGMIYFIIIGCLALFNLIPFLLDEKVWTIRLRRLFVLALAVMFSAEWYAAIVHWALRDDPLWTLLLAQLAVGIGPTLWMHQRTKRNDHRMLLGTPKT